jgi:hypothetical protein
MLDDDTLGRKITAYLGRQPEVPVRIAYQLNQARARALMRVDTPRPAWARLGPWMLSFRAGVVIALAVLGLVYATWQRYSPEPDLADVEAQLLSDDLPPAAYLDTGFARVVSGTVIDHGHRETRVPR